MCLVKLGRGVFILETFTLSQKLPLALQLPMDHKTVTTQ